MSAGGVVQAQGPRQLFDLRVPVRDGITLSCRVFFPAGGRDAGPYPVVLERGCYSSQLYQAEYVGLRDHGYAVVLQDVRGRGDSDGVFRPIEQEAADGFDTIEWLAAQPWCTGAVGTIGNSYAGWTQWAALGERPPHLRAAWVTVPAGSLMRQEPFDHGVPMLAVLPWLHFTGARTLQTGADIDWERVLNHLPLGSMDDVLGRSLPVWRSWLSQPRLDDHWTGLAVTDLDDLGVPTVVASGWWDSNLRGAVELHRHLVDGGNEHQHLVLGPWGHGDVGEQHTESGHDFTGGTWDVRSARRNWFDRWLKGSEPTSASGVDPTGGWGTSSVFVTGACRWRVDDTWPPPAREQEWFLGSDGSRGTLTRAPMAQSSSRRYVHDPAHPVPSHRGGWDLYPWSIREGLGGPAAAEPVPVDDTRTDVLTWLSEPLSDELEVVGEPCLRLHVEVDRADTDWFVTVADVPPDPTGEPPLVVCEGRLRARFREGLDREVLLVPGEVARVSVPLRPMAHRFLRGHRIRLTVAGSSFPAYARNSGTGGEVLTDEELLVAAVTIHQGSDVASALILPEVTR